MCPAPGISQPTAGANTDIMLTGSACAALAFSVVEFAIQIFTISRWIFPVTSADFGRTSTFTSLRTPNSGR